MPTPTHIEIARQAEYLWRLRGCPAGQDMEIWSEAERQLSLGLSSGGENPGTFTERVKEDTAAESVVEFQISPAGSKEDAIRAALQKPAAPESKSPSSHTGTPGR